MFLENSIVKEDMENIYSRNIDWNLLQNSKVLITGAYGMLASYIAFFLIYLCEHKNMNIRIMLQGRNIQKAQKRFGELLNRTYVEYTAMDLNKEIMSEETIDYIIHAAGGANPRLYSSNPVEVIEPNVIGTYNLLEYARKHGNKGFLIFSSGDVYGKVDEPENISEETVGKVDQLDIHSCYSESKRMAETIAVSYFREYGIPIKILRIGHTYGPTMDIKNDPRVFASFLKCVLEKRNIEMLSDGLAKRPFCYLADAVAAYFIVLFKGDAGGAYNICNTGEFISMRELANIVLTLEKRKKLKVVYLGRGYEDGYVENKENKDNNPSDKKLKRLGFEYHFTTETGMERTYKFLKETEIWKD